MILGQGRVGQAILILVCIIDLLARPAIQQELENCEYGIVVFSGFMSSPAELLWHSEHEYCSVELAM
jgi:hypothetical protein